MLSQQLSTSSADFDSTKQSQLIFKSKIENVTNGSNMNTEHNQRNRSTSICPPGNHFRLHSFRAYLILVFMHILLLNTGMLSCSVNG